MKQIKQRISILLCFLLAFTTIFMAAPEETQAATTKYEFRGVDNVTVYKGATNFYAGDLVSASTHTGTNYYENYNYLGYLSSLKNVTYKSSNTSVASIDKNTGKITTKKTGTAKITMTYKKHSSSFELKVVTASNLYKELAKQSTYGDSVKASYWKNFAASTKKEAKAFLKKTGETVTLNKSNRYEFLSILKSSDYPDSGCNTGRTIYLGQTPQVSIYSTDSLRANIIYQQIRSYTTSFNSYGTGIAYNIFEIKSISGKAKSDTVTVTLKDKVTADQLFTLNYIYNWDTDVKESSTYTFPVQIQRTSSGYKYYATATVKKGSNKMTIQLKNTKLKKGESYKLILRTTGAYNKSYTMSYNISLGKDTFKAK